MPVELRRRAMLRTAWWPRRSFGGYRSGRGDFGMVTLVAFAGLAIAAATGWTAFVQERIHRETIERDYSAESARRATRHEEEVRRLVQERDRAGPQNVARENALLRELEVSKAAIASFQKALEASRAEIAELQRQRPGAR